MSEIRKKIEGYFEALGYFIYDNRIKTLLVMAVLIFSMASGVPKVRFDTSTEALLHKDDPILEIYNNFRDQFGRDEIIFIAIKPPEIFNPAFLDKLKSLHGELEEKVPHLEEITSLINARHTRGDGDQLIVGDLMETWPQNQADLEIFKHRVRSNPMYKNLLISEDGRVTTLMIKTRSFSGADAAFDPMTAFDDPDIASDKEELTAEQKYLTDEENSAVVNAVREVLARFEGPDFPVHMAGSPVFTNDLKRYMLRDARLFILLAMITVSVFLAILFRNISGVVMPVIVVVLSLLSTIGLMGHFGVTIKLPTNVLPSFLLAVGVGDSVHILTLFYRHMQQGSRKKDAISLSLGHSGLAVFFTSITTAGGLFSFVTAEIAPIAELGIFGGVGVMLAMLYTVVLLPALLSLFPIHTRQRIKNDKGESLFLDRFLAYFGDISTAHPVKVLIVSSGILIVAVIGLMKAEFTHNAMVWFPEEMSIRKSTEMLDREMKGATVLEVIVDTGVENGVHNPGFLNKLESMRQYAESYEQGPLFVGKAMSIVDILKESNQALNENSPGFYKIPQNSELISQELLLFENSGSDDLEDFVDSQFRKARFTIKVPWLDAIVYTEFIKSFEEKFANTFAGEATTTITGLVVILVRTLSAAIYSMAKSYLIAFVVITFLMILLIGDLKLGIVSMIPNLAPIIICLGLIGFTKIPLDMFTMMIGSVAIGLAVDDTIHFMYNFRKYYYETGDVRQAVHETLQTTGRAMLFTSLVLSCGFFIMLFSAMKNLNYFGLLTGISIIMALLADFFMAPALMAMIHKKRI